MIDLELKISYKKSERNEERVPRRMNLQAPFYPSVKTFGNEKETPDRKEGGLAEEKQ